MEGLKSYHDTYDGLPVLMQSLAPRWKVKHFWSWILHSGSGENLPLSSNACSRVHGHLNTAVANLSPYSSLVNHSSQRWSFHLPFEPYSRSHCLLKYQANGIGVLQITGDSWIFRAVIGFVRLIAMKPKKRSVRSGLYLSLNFSVFISNFRRPSLTLSSKVSM